MPAPMYQGDCGYVAGGGIVCGNATDDPLNKYPSVMLFVTTSSLLLRIISVCFVRRSSTFEYKTSLGKMLTPVFADAR